MVRCEGVRAAAFVNFEQDEIVVQCIGADRWRVSNDRPPTRTRLKDRPNSPIVHTEEWGPAATGDGWEILAKPGTPIIIERDGDEIIEIPTENRVWRLSADASGTCFAWLEEDGVLRFRDENGMVHVVASDIDYHTALFVTASGESIIASVDQSFGAFNKAVKRWSWHVDDETWRVDGVLYPYGGPIQGIAEALDAGLWFQFRL